MSRIIPICTFLFGTYWAYKGWFEYEFWVNNGPGGGFLAVIIGALLAVISGIEVLENTKPLVQLERKHVLPVIGTILMLWSISLFGMIFSFGLFILSWLIMLEKYPKRKALIIGVSSTAVIYFIFKFFLHVPFPTGYLGI